LLSWGTGYAPRVFCPRFGWAVPPTVDVTVMVVSAVTVRGIGFVATVQGQHSGLSLLQPTKPAQNTVLPASTSV